MVVIRLARAGTKKKPFFHLTVTDRRNPRDGRFIERVGFFNPIARGQAVESSIDIERIDYWMSHGAIPSPKVKSLIKNARKQKLAADQTVDEPIDDQESTEPPAESSEENVETSESSEDSSDPVVEAEPSDESEDTPPESDSESEN